MLLEDGTASTVATAGNTESSPTPLTEAELGRLAHQFELDGIARDRQADSATGDVGVNEIKDIISVVVNGRTASPAPGNAVDTAPAGSNAWFSVTVAEPGTDAGETPGGGITHIQVRREMPRVADDTLSVTYRVTEFDFGTGTTAGGDRVASKTPLNLASSSVRYGGANYANATSQVNLSSVADVSMTLTGTGVLADHVVATFAYDVQDKKAELVTLNSGSAGDRELDTEETSANSSIFQTKVAIFSVEDYALINTEAGNNDNKGDDDVVQVTELNANNGLSDEEDTGERSLGRRVQDSATALGLCMTATQDGCTRVSTAAEFLEQVIPARHGDVINVVYVDTNPSVRISKTATVDLEAPVVTLISPADKLFTNTSTVSFSVDVVDTGAGVPESNDEFAPVITAHVDAGIQLDTIIRTPIVNGYRLTANPDQVIQEGEKKWFAGVRDKVGNEPVVNDPDTDANEAPRGAAAVKAPSATNPFVFTVDTRAPELSTGETGWYLKNPGVTSGNAQEEEKPNNRTWVRVVFETPRGRSAPGPCHC